jgi:CarD family transcriptional regulator
LIVGAFWAARGLFCADGLGFEWESDQMTKTKKAEFRPNEFVVYPAHGVGRIISIEEQEIAGLHLELFVISFEKDKMTLRVPTHKATEIGMRSLSSPDLITKALDTLKGKARVKRAMWSRRAQEYEQKINSGDLLSIAEVVRDLHRTDDQREQSYSERQLYEAALERLTREVAAVSGVDEKGAQKTVDDVLMSRAA